MRIASTVATTIGISFLVTATAATHRGRASTPCVSAANDTVRLAGLAEDGHRIGSLALWSDSNGAFHYAESWRLDTTTYRWEGDIDIGEAGLPRAVAVRT